MPTGRQVLKLTLAGEAVSVVAMVAHAYQTPTQSPEDQEKVRITRKDLAGAPLLSAQCWQAAVHEVWVLCRADGARGGCRQTGTGPEVAEAQRSRS